MSDARNAILARLNHTKKAKPNTLSRRPPPNLSQEQKIALFIQKLEENRAEVHRTEQTNWAKKLTEIANNRKLNTWLLGNNLSEVEQVKLALMANLKKPSIVHYSQQYESIKSTLFHDIEASFTLAKAGIADTGTLVLIPDQNEPRMMSLVPPIHIVLINEYDIMANFQQLVDHPPWPTQKMPSNIVFISSPSKTADIQQTLAYGAHGPKELIVLIRK